MQDGRFFEFHKSAFLEKIGTFVYRIIVLCYDYKTNIRFIRFLHTHSAKDVGGD